MEHLYVNSFDELFAFAGEHIVASKHIALVPVTSHDDEGNEEVGFWCHEELVPADEEGAATFCDTYRILKLVDGHENDPRVRFWRDTEAATQLIEDIVSGKVPT